jgi:hypothetical protein
MMIQRWVIPLCVLAILNQQPSQSVHNVKIIGAAQIERQGAVNLKDILTKELNVRIGLIMYLVQVWPSGHQRAEC